MSSLSPSKSEPDTLTTQEIIEYLQQQAEHLGEVGFTLNFPDPHTLGQPVERLYPSFATSEFMAGQPASTADQDEMIFEAMKVADRTMVQIDERAVRLRDPRNKPGMLAAEQEVDRQLVAASFTSKYLRETGLRKKCGDLLEMKMPPQPANFIAVTIRVPGVATKKRDMLSCHLPLKAAIEDVHQMLETLVAEEVAVVTGYMDRKERPAIRRGPSGWKYQLIPRKQKRSAINASRKLDSDDDYRGLINALTKGKPKMDAVLTKVRTDLDDSL